MNSEEKRRSVKLPQVVIQINENQEAEHPKLTEAQIVKPREQEVKRVKSNDPRVLNYEQQLQEAIDKDDV